MKIKPKKFIYTYALDISMAMISGDWNIEIAEKLPKTIAILKYV